MTTLGPRVRSYKYEGDGKIKKKMHGQVLFYHLLDNFFFGRILHFSIQIKFTFLPALTFPALLRYGENIKSYNNISEVYKYTFPIFSIRWGQWTFFPFVQHNYPILFKIETFCKQYLIAFLAGYFCYTQNYRNGANIIKTDSRVSNKIRQVG